MSGIESFRPVSAKPVFSLANRLERVLFGLGWLLLCRFTPPQLHAWRRFVLIMFGARIGKQTRIYASAKIWLPRNLKLGGGCLIGPGVRLYNQGRIEVGDNCVISQRAHLCASTHSLSDPSFGLILKPVTIGRGCWIAAEAFVGPGVRMAEGSVLAARAALFDDADAMTIYRGNPAVPIGRRALN